MGYLPWFAPGLLLTFAVASVAAARASRALLTRSAVAWLLIASIGLIASATLTPSRLALEYGTTSPIACDFSRVTPISPSQFLRFDDPGLNVLLFVPLGIAVGLLPRSRWKTILLLVSLVLSPFVETTQLLVPALDRACQSADVVDNLTGLVIGLVLGATAGWIALRARRAT